MNIPCDKIFPCVPLFFTLTLEFDLFFEFIYNFNVGNYMKYLAVFEILLNLVSDCRSTCHPDGKDILPLPCISLAPGTPGGDSCCN